VPFNSILFISSSIYMPLIKLALLTLYNLSYLNASLTFNNIVIARFK
jgi:hypothetical protein